MPTNAVVDRLARELAEAASTAIPIPQLTSSQDIDVDEAYAIQRAVVEHRYARGERPAGVKLGFTSAAKMTQMGVSDAIIGRLTDGMQVTDGGVLRLAGFVHPRVEPELAFRLHTPVDPDSPAAEPAAMVDAVAPALEVIDSRYRDFRFSLPDVIADNTSAAAFVVGPWVAWEQCPDLGNLGVRLEIDGALTDTGSTAAILGHPARAVSAALRLARHYRIALPAGSIILAGAATAAHPLRPGTTVDVTVAELGRASLSAKGDSDA